ncbi:MAG: cobalamin-dependent protein [Deltaproteobacteria bacterium]|nr:cobalamin-dependent protein [Deltaproteobacteria bacterium]
MNILLVSLNRLAAPFPVHPLGLDHVAGALEPSHQVDIVDLAAPGASLAQALARQEPQVVGLSLRNLDNVDHSQPQGFLEAAREAVEEISGLTRAPLVLGGSGFSIMPARVLARLGADYGVVGEGERFRAVAEALAAGRSPAGLPGVVLPGQPAPRPGPWDGVPRRRLPRPGPALAHYLDRGGMLGLQTKRGCPFRCAYCTYPYLEGHGLRLLEPAAAAQEALALERAGARFLFVVDSVFNAHPAHSLAVARAFRQAGLGIPWGGFFAPLPMPPGYYQELAAAGLTHVEFGTEALDEATLTAYGKPFTWSQALAAHAAALEAGLFVAHYLLLGGPGETPDTLARTLERAAGLRQGVVFLFEAPRIFPGTLLCARALAEGVVTPEHDLLEPVFYRSPGLPPAQAQEMIAQAAKGRADWITGAGGARLASLVAGLHRHGHAGPLWERLIRG